MDEELQLFTKHTDGYPDEYGYGPEWVAMAMYMDDFPKFYSEEEAKNYWEVTLKKEQEEYDRRKNDKASESYSSY